MPAGRPPVHKTEADRLATKRANDRRNSNRYNRRDRLEALQAYGGMCICCGETNQYFLSLDHSNFDGNISRQQIGTGNVFVRWLKTRNYPQDLGLVVLCWNCHLAKDFYGICPHTGIPNSEFVRATGPKPK